MNVDNIAYFIVKMYVDGWLGLICLTVVPAILIIMVYLEKRSIPK